MIEVSIDKTKLHFNKTQETILRFILTNTDTDVERNTHCRMKDRITSVKKTAIHTNLKGLVKRRILVEDWDKFIASNNQPMNVVRYFISPDVLESVKESLRIKP